MPETRPSISRRDFLIGVLGVPIGALAGVAFGSTAAVSEFGIDQVSPRQTGNAAEDQYIAKTCGDPPDALCADEFISSPEMQINIGFIDPIVKEGAFRAAPSYVLNTIEKELGLRSDDPSSLEPSGNTMHLTRREAGVGAIAVIADLFYSTSPGHQPRRWPLPVAEALRSVLGWWLQRRIGYQAAVPAHSAFSLILEQTRTRHYE